MQITEDTRFNIGDRVLQSDSTMVIERFRQQIGTVVDKTNDTIVVSFDNIPNPLGKKGWKTSGEFLERLTSFDEVLDKMVGDFIDQF